jgi:hypothetical protein
MKKLFLVAMVAVFCMAPLTQISAQPKEAVNQELSEHPRIAAAITNLEDAIAYMESAPHNFGGHKAAAIAECRKAINQLRKAMAFRARREGK